MSRRRLTNKDILPNTNYFSSVKDNYNIIGRIGCGRYSNAYVIQNATNGEVVTAKFIEVSLFCNDNSFNQNDLLKVVVQGIENTKTCQDICELARHVGYTVESEGVTIFSEYFPNGSLDSLFACGYKDGLPKRLLKGITKQIVSGLANIHHKGLAHGNITPSNIFISDKTNMSIKIGDLSLYTESSKLKSLNSYNGRYDENDFLSPECLKSYKLSYGKAMSNLDISDFNQGSKNDAYSLGITLIKLSLGKRMLSYNKFRKVPNCFTLKKILSQYIDYREVTDDLADLIANCINYNPEKRYSMDQISNHHYLTTDLNCPYTFPFFATSTTPSSTRTTSMSDFLYGNFHSSAGMTPILVPTSNYISHLILTESEISDDDLVSLSDRFKFIKHLSGLYLKNNNFGEEGSLHLFENIKYLTKLRYLDVGRNHIPDSGIVKLSENLKYLSGLTLLNLSYVQINDGITKFFENLKYLSGLQSLDLSCNIIAEELIIKFFDNLKYLPRLRVLELGYVQLTANGAISLAKVLRHMPLLENLGLRNDYIEEDEIVKLFGVLKFLPKLTHLNLTSNNMGDKGIVALSENIIHVPRLEELDLSYIQIKDNSIIRLFNNLKHISHLQRLDVSCNNVKGELMMKLFENLRFIPYLNYLDLSSSNIGENEAAKLSENILYVRRLRHLDLSSNNISDEGIGKLSALFQHLCDLQEIYMTCNKIGDSGYESLSQNIKYLTNLKYIYLSGNTSGKLNNVPHWGNCLDILNGATE